MALADAIVALIDHRPGLTEAQLATELFGRAGYQQRVNSTCRRLVKQGRVERRGQGYSSDPFTYYASVR